MKFLLVFLRGLGWGLLAAALVAIPYNFGYVFYYSEAPGVEYILNSYVSMVAAFWISYIHYRG